MLTKRGPTTRSGLHWGAPLALRKASVISVGNFRPEVPRTECDVLERLEGVPNCNGSIDDVEDLPEVKPKDVDQVGRQLSVSVFLWGY